MVRSKKNKKKKNNKIILFFSTLGPFVMFVQDLMKLLANVKLKFLSCNLANTLINLATHIFAPKLSMYLKIS